MRILGLTLWLPVVTATIWNREHAWAYPAIDLNAGGELGISMAWGGGNIHFANHAVAVLDPNLTTPVPNLTTTASNIGQAGWGDYVGIQRDRKEALMFCATGYSHQKSSTGPRADMRYVLFHS